MRSTLALLVLAAAAAACSSTYGGAPSDVPAEVPEPTPVGDAGVATPAADADASPAAEQLYFPPAGGTWATVDPASAGWDAGRLEAAAQLALQRASRTFIVLHNGRIMLERYAGADASSTRDIASAQKSITSLLVGIAVARKIIDPAATVTAVLGAGWSKADAASEAKITVAQLLSMTSGLDLSLGYAAPAGSAWLYNNDAYYRVKMVLEKKTGKDIATLSATWLFAPIGATQSTWGVRPGADSTGLPITGLAMSARDMARVGLLVQAGGAWSGAPVVPAAYLDVALDSSQALNPSYGLLFWLNGKSFALSPGGVRVEGPLVPSAPKDLVAALGANDQKIYVVPSEGLVVVRQGGRATDVDVQALSGFDEELWAKLMLAKSTR